jgi:glycine cleavage system H protein
MPAPAEVRYLKSHEWARQDGDLVTVGLSEYAVEQLNREIVYVELPEPGRVVTQGEPFGVIEAVKAAEDLYSPVSGVVEEVNANLEGNPALVAESPLGGGWMIKVRPSNPSEWENLLSATDYQQFIQSGEPH